MMAIWFSWENWTPLLFITKVVNFSKNPIFGTLFDEYFSEFCGLSLTQLFVKTACPLAGCPEGF